MACVGVDAPGAGAGDMMSRMMGRTCHSDPPPATHSREMCRTSIYKSKSHVADSYHT